MDIDPATLPLRDIHLPMAVAWWPPAWGWWVVAVLLATGIVAVLLFARRRRQKKPQRECLQILARAQRLAERGQTGPALGSVSVGLKRLAMTLYPEEPVAGLAGQCWLEWLDAHGTGSFTSGEAEALARLPYTQSGATLEESMAVIQSARAWARSQ